VGGYKYDPLGALLADAASRGDRELELRFDDVDKVVGGLPASARKYREWWANSGQPQSVVWRGAGWRVAGVNQSGGNWVRFERDDAAPPARAGVNVAVAIGPTRTRASRRPQGAVDWANRAAVGELGVTVKATWREGGPITLDAQGGITFPELPWAPGAYRMTLTGAPGQGRPRVYIGETDLLQRRMAHYRNPGPTQSTNIRMNAALRKHLASGGVASIAFIADALARTAGEEAPLVALDISRKAARRLIENAALVSAYLAGDADIENID
jgi:hypothetical protein